MLGRPASAAQRARAARGEKGGARRRCGRRRRCVVKYHAPLLSTRGLASTSPSRMLKMQSAWGLSLATPVCMGFCVTPTASILLRTASDCKASETKGSALGPSTTLHRSFNTLGVHVWWYRCSVAWSYSAAGAIVMLSVSSLVACQPATPRPLSCSHYTSVRSHSARILTSCCARLVATALAHAGSAA